MGNSDKKKSFDYAEVCSLFAKAEDKLKKVEHLAGGIVVPAINQLRYAGQHLVRTLVGCESPDEELHLATNHCKRASYDACEAGLLYCLKLFKQFQDDYRKTNIVPVLPEYLEYCSTARTAQNLIKISQDTDRANSYEEAEKCLYALIAVTDKLPVAREELNKTLRHDRVIFYIILLTLIITIIGVGISAVPHQKPMASASSGSMPK